MEFSNENITLFLEIILYISRRTTQRQTLDCIKFYEDTNFFINCYLLPKKDNIMDLHVLVGFKEILRTNIYQELCKYAENPPPLSAIGFFLRIVGNTLLR